MTRQAPDSRSFLYSNITTTCNDILRIDFLNEIILLLKVALVYSFLFA